MKDAIATNRKAGSPSWKLLLCTAWVAASSSLAGVGSKIWVSLEGDDGHTGSVTAPLRTLDGARRQVRHHPLRGHQPITVLFTAGTYYIDDTVRFTHEDSGTARAPVVYASAPDDEVVLSGGRRLNVAWQEHRGLIRKAWVGTELRIDQLFVNGTRQPMARTPNTDPSAQYFQGFAEDCDAPARVATWADPEGGYLHAMHASLWGDMHWRIERKRDDGTLELAGGWQNNRQMGAHKTYRFVENILEELDAPGEWFHDPKTGWLYWIPPPDLELSRAVVEAAGLRQLLTVEGTEGSPVAFLQFRGFTLRHSARTFMENREPLVRSDWTTSRSGSLYFRGTEDCQVTDCFLDAPGGNGIFVDGYNRRLRIAGTHIENAGASSISFVGRPEALRSPLFEYHQTQALDEIDPSPGPKSTDYPADCLVEDCLLVRNGRVEKQTAGVNIAMAESITVRHCSIYDCPRAGINICDGAFGGHLIEFNDVFDTVKETGDHGSFNSWGRDRFWHPDRAVTARWVKEHPDMPLWDHHRPTVIRNNRWRCDHGWDIDLDDGSSHYVLADNLCLAGGIKLREGYYRTVTNNIVVGWTFCPHVWYPESRTTFARNIIWENRYRPAGMQTLDQAELIDSNLVHRSAAAPEPASGLQGFGGDRHSLLGDARFLDPASGDYRVAPNSPALQLGFRNFPMDRFGVRKPDLKRKARTPPLPGSLEAAAIRSGGWDRPYALPEEAEWWGVTLRTLNGAADRSAVGLGESGGVLVARADSNTQAYTLGLRSNDVILAVGDGPVDTLEAFATALRQLPPASSPVFGIWRNQSNTNLVMDLPDR